jgi:hypothetical protein
LPSCVYDGCRFATAYPGKYSDSISQAYVYPSSNFLDDIAWAATWLYQRTGEQQFLTVSQHSSLQYMCGCVCVRVCVCVCVCCIIHGLMHVMHYVILSVRGCHPVSECR